MKLYLAYKKQFKLVFLGFLLVFPIIFPVVFSHAQTAKELQNKIDNSNAEIERLEKEIKAYQGQLNTLSQQKSSLAGSLKQLDINRKKLIADIAVTQNKIDKTNYKIESLTSQIGDKQDSISNNRDAIALGIKAINEFEQNTLVEVVLSENSFTTAWTDIDNAVTVRNTLRNKITELLKVKTDLEGVKEETTKARNELVQLRAELADQKKIVEQNTREKNQLLAQTKNSEANYQKLLKDKIAKRDAFEKELQDYEAQLQFVLDPSKLPGKGILGWPLEKIYVTSAYGPRWGRFHAGVDLRASMGTQVMAMAEGVVKGVGDTDLCCPGASFGKWIFIEYNNGLSGTFAHLSLISVKSGQRVKRGDVVGYSGNSGSSTGPHLHVSIYVPSGVKVDSFASKSYPGKILIQPIAATNAYLDPMFYLPPYKI